DRRPYRRPDQSGLALVTQFQMPAPELFPVASGSGMPGSTMDRSGPHTSPRRHPHPTSEIEAIKVGKPQPEGRPTRGRGRASLLLCGLLPVREGALLAGAADGEGVFRRVLGDGAAGGDVGAAADDDGGDELGVGADEDVVADEGGVLVDAVVVAGDDAGA